MECSADNIHLLLAGQLDEVHRVSGNTDSQLRIFLRMLHRIEQSGSVKHIDIEMVSAVSEVTIEQADEV